MISVEDRHILRIMDNGLLKMTTADGKASLPLKHPRSQLRNNRSQAVKRVQVLDWDLKRNPKRGST